MRWDEYQYLFDSQRVLNEPYKLPNHLKMLTNTTCQHKHMSTNTTSQQRPPSNKYHLPTKTTYQQRPPANKDDLPTRATC